MNKHIKFIGTNLIGVLLLYIIASILELNLNYSYALPLSISNAKNSAELNYHNIIKEYINIPENIKNKLKLIDQSTDSQSGLTKLEYILSSQVWPKSNQKSNQKLWQHHLNIYIPSEIKSTTALLWINGGTSHMPQNNSLQQYAKWLTPHELDFGKIANATHSIVIDLQDIPNQYFVLDGKELAEDALIAYTWSKFLDNPVENKYYSAYLPMVKAVVTTMDKLSNINFTKYHHKTKNLYIKDFVLAGSSKRGMTTWLTALNDTRVKAIIPVVIDALNFEHNIQHIYHSLQDWPAAMHDYYEQNIVQRINDKNIKYLMQINDPYQYIKCPDCSNLEKNFFHKRASIDKYIILASGDDFFAPDSLRFYHDELPGNTYIRYLPNSGHIIKTERLSNAVLAFYNNIINQEFTKSYTPDVNSYITKDLTSKNLYKINISTTDKPKNIILYTAVNKSNRDFRLANNVTYTKTIIDVNKFNKYIHTKTGGYFYKIALTKPEQGWQASFVELEYESSNADSSNYNQALNLKLTSKINILPMQYPDKIKHAIKSKIKNIAQYGKKVVYP